MSDSTNERILFLCEYKSLYGGNFIPSLIALEEELEKKNASCVYAFPPDAKDREWVKYLEQNGKCVVFFDFRAEINVFKEKLDKIVKENGITVIHAHFAPMMKLEKYSKANKNVRIFIHIHSDFSAGKKDIKLSAKNFLIFKLCAGRVKFFSVSKAFVEYNPKKISYISNGLAEKRLANNTTGRDELRKELNIADDMVFCEIFGWSPYVKGLDVAVNAIRKANEASGGRFVLGVVCGREMTPEKMKEWIKSKTGCSGEEDFIRYLVPREDVFAFHNAADLLISASRSEGFSYSILEMLSLGKHCVISDIPGVQWAKEYATVKAFPSENPDKCAAVLIETAENGLDSDPGVAKKSAEDYSISKWTDAVINGYGIK